MLGNWDCQPEIDRIGAGGKINIMQPKRYIVWSKREIDLGDPFQRKWYIKQVLLHGKSEDVALLDWDEIKTLLHDLDLPPDIKNLWGNYFNAS